MKHLPALTLLISLALAGPSLAAEPKEIGWGDLQPEVEEVENPFEYLTYEEMTDLRVQLKWTTASAEQQQNPEFRELAEGAMDRLAEAGHDFQDLMEKRDILIKARTKANTSPNEELIGENVRIPGYVLPLEFDGQKVIEFLLVPTIGACIHTPAPPANQVVHVTYADGIEVDGLFSAVWVEGALTADLNRQAINFSDGIAPVSSTYILSASTVVDYE
ncbi:DUF3299 domain-containing protein [Shimia sediminis]|uniref:DUF3299 domain-containing protein n=1 Tax=Shimia sediminis TaxID=2497945 RepID=UPI000F8EA09F|nr:DUF3299 domain-containing protein [Shimia sediminis]